MLTNLNGTLWPTLEALGRGIEIARCGWGTPDALAAAQTGEIPALWLCNPNAGGCPAVAAGYHGDMYAPDPECWKEVS